IDLGGRALAARGAHGGGGGGGARPPPAASGFPWPPQGSPGAPALGSSPSWGAPPFSRCGCRASSPCNPPPARRPPPPHPPPPPPIGVAQMIVDGRILGLELNRPIERLDGLIEVADPVERPAERIDDIAVVGPLLDRAPDHAHALFEIDALVDPGIAEIVEHVRLVGKELERHLVIGLGPRPLLGALEADAAEIIDYPVRLFGLPDGVDALAMAVRGFI